MNSPQKLAVMRATTRKIRALATPFFSSEHKWRARGCRSSSQVCSPSRGGRAFAGIWPFTHGTVAIPADTMCIPQNPYFPDGRLRDALAYPEPADRYSEDELREALEAALLPQLASRLDDEDAWTQKLSGGERQRLALARVFLKKPAWVLADEATSALDEQAEHTLYERLTGLIRRRGGALVSIAHRPALDAFHGRRWELGREPAGAVAAFRVRQA